MLSYSSGEIPIWVLDEVEKRYGKKWRYKAACSNCKHVIFFEELYYYCTVLGRKVSSEWLCPFWKPKVVNNA